MPSLLSHTITWEAEAGRSLSSRPVRTITQRNLSPKKIHFSCLWRTLVGFAGRRQRQEDHEFEASLGYTFKKKEKEKNFSLKNPEN